MEELSFDEIAKPLGLYFSYVRECVCYDTELGKTWVVGWTVGTWEAETEESGIQGYLGYMQVWG